MNDPTDAERAAFGARLTGAIPTEPDLTSLAARAETGARRTGRVRRAGVAGVAAVAVAAVIAVPQMLGSHHVPSSNPPQLPAHPCKGTPDHQDFTKGTAVWVTFCPRRPVGHDAVTSLIPPQVLTTGTAGLVAGWQRSTGMAHSCPLGPYGGTEFTIRVGFTDGTTTRIDGATDTCQAGITPGNGSIGIAPGATVYDDLAAALGRQTASGHPRYNPPGPPLSVRGRWPRREGSTSTELRDLSSRARRCCLT